MEILNDLVPANVIDVETAVEKVENIVDKVVEMMLLVSVKTVFCVRIREIFFIILCIVGTIVPQKFIMFWLPKEDVVGIVVLGGGLTAVQAWNGIKYKNTYPYVNCKNVNPLYLVNKKHWSYYETVKTS